MKTFDQHGLEIPSQDLHLAFRTGSNSCQFVKFVSLLLPQSSPKILKLSARHPHEVPAISLLCRTFQFQFCFCAPALPRPDSHNNSHDNSHINVTRRFSATPSSPSKSAAVPRKRRNQKNCNSHINVTNISPPNGSGQSAIRNPL